MSYSNNPLIINETLGQTITQGTTGHEIDVGNVALILLKVHAYEANGGAGYVNLKIKPNNCISKLRIYSPNWTAGGGGSKGPNGGTNGAIGGDAVSVTCVLNGNTRNDGYENNIIAVIGGGGGNGGNHGNSAGKGGNTSDTGQMTTDREYTVFKGGNGSSKSGTAAAYGGIGGNQPMPNTGYKDQNYWYYNYPGGQVNGAGQGGRGGPFAYNGSHVSGGGTSLSYTAAGEYGRSGTGGGGAGGGGGATTNPSNWSLSTAHYPPGYLNIGCGGGGGGSQGGNDCGGGGGGAGYEGGNGGGGGKGEGQNFGGAGGGGGSTAVRHNNSITLDGVGSVGIEIDSTALGNEIGEYSCIMFKNTGYSTNGEDLVHKFKLRDNSYSDNNPGLDLRYDVNGVNIRDAFEAGGSSSDPTTGFKYTASFSTGDITSDLSKYLEPS